MGCQGHIWISATEDRALLARSRRKEIDHDHDLELDLDLDLDLDREYVDRGG